MANEMESALLANENAVRLRLAEEGYDYVGTRPLGGEFVAEAVKQVGATPYRASAIGRTKIDAARSLVKVITRP
jgi:hypothetical protein